MVGIAGSAGSSGDLDTIADPLIHEPWYVRNRVNAGQYQIENIAHDEESQSHYSEGDRIAVLHGMAFNGDGNEVVLDEIVGRLFENPPELLANLEGPFVIAAANAKTGRLLLATDKMATIPCYYTHTDGFAFATEVKGVVASVEDPTPDVSAIADLLATEFVWGEKTLVEEARAIPPANVLELKDGEIDITRYWSFDFSNGGNGYVSTLVDSYRDAATTVAEGTADSIGMMLSGGLDSRALAACLAESDVDFRTYTYDANPAGEENVRSARKVSEQLGIENELVEFTPDEFVEVLEQGIALADGLAPWIHYHNLPFTLEELHEKAGTLVNISGQGEFFGEDILLHRVTGPNAFRDRVYELAIPDVKSDSPLGGLVQQFVHMGQEAIDEVLTVSTSIESSIRSELERSGPRHASRDHRILETVYRNFYPNFHFKSNNIARSQTRVRSVFTTGALLDAIAAMPHRYRRRLPQVTSRLKLAVVRELNLNMENIPYERTGLVPKRSLIHHTASYLTNEVLPGSSGTPGSRPLILPSKLMQRLLGSGDYSMYGTWYRDHDDLNELVGSLLTDACNREYFNEKALRRLDREHNRGERDHIGVIAIVTTIESWFQQFVD